MNSEIKNDQTDLYESVLSKIKKFIGENFLPDKTDELGEDDSLLELGVIQSLSLVRILNFIEDEFQIQVPPEDFYPEKFSTLAVITKYVLRQQS